MGVHVAFFIVTLIIVALLNIYIPHCMREVGKKDDRPEGIDNNGGRPLVLPKSRFLLTSPLGEAGAKRRRYGFSMTVFGTINSIAGGVVMLVITIILSTTLDGAAAESRYDRSCTFDAASLPNSSSGLIVTTAVGFVTVAGSAVAYAGLPILPSKSTSKLTENWSQPLLEGEPPHHIPFWMKITDLDSKFCHHSKIFSCTRILESC